MHKVGILGAGFMGAMHAAVYSQFPDIKIAGIADIRADRAKSLAEKFRSIPYYSADDLFAREDITIIDICLPTFLHKEAVIRAAELHRDIVCEKPIALTLEDADEMISTCRAKNVRFMVAHVIRFWNEYRYLKEMHDRGRWGKLLWISMSRLSPTPTWGWENWFLDPSKSGSALLDLHIHDTDFLLYLVGEKPVSVMARSRQTEIGHCHVASTFRFASGLVASVEGGWDFPPTYPFVMSFTALYEKAAVEFNSRAKPTLTVYEHSGKIERPVFETKKADLSAGNIGDLGGYYYELRYFFEHVVHSKPFAVISPEQARESLAVVLKERESAEQQKEVAL